MSVTYFNSLNDNVTEFLQWGLFEELKITGVSVSPVPIIMFSNGCCNGLMSVEPFVDHGNLLVTVPNEVLEDYGSVIIYICQTDENDSSTTLDRVRIPVVPRPRPSDYYEIIEEVKQANARLRLSVGELDHNVLG